MNKKNNSLEYIKRQAKKLKRERDISHSTALDLVATQNGYSNWKHFHRILSQDPMLELKIASESPELSFTDWLKRHKNRDSPLGDLAMDMLSVSDWPSYKTFEEYETYLRFRHASYDAVVALKNGWKSYKGYLKRKENPTSKNNSSIKKTVPEKHDDRKITFVKDAKPVHINNRKAEKFAPGDPAWVSWNGRKAIPVIITEVDDRHYTFKIERPLKNAGDIHYLFLDEVRSTPELACMNYVTL